MRLIAAAQTADDPVRTVAIRVPAFQPKIVGRDPRILGIDIENRPDWYGGGDYVYDRIVCISWKWTSDDEVFTAFLDWRNQDGTILRQLAPLWHALHYADSFLGHNFRHDWKGIQTLFRELHQPPLERRPIIDTMRCIPAGIPRGLGDLCVRFGLGDKPHLTGRDWTDALERRIPAKIELVKTRNREDVILTERLWRKEQELGWL
jgi:hypothetical protein